MSPTALDFNFDVAVLETPQLRRRVGALLRAWLYDLQDSTRKNFTYDLHQFATYVLGEDLPLPSERDDTRAAIVVYGLLWTQHVHVVVSGFLESLTDRDYRPSTVTRKLKSLQLWARHLYERRAAPQSLDALSLPSASSLVPHDSVTASSSTDERAALERLPPEVRSRAYAVLEARDQAIVTLLSHSTLQPTRLLELDWKGLDFGKHPPREDCDALSSSIRIEVPRRYGQAFWRPLTLTASRAMKRWYLAYIRFFRETPPPDRPVFTTLSGKRMSPSQLREVVNDARTPRGRHLQHHY